MFIINLTYIKDRSEVDKLLEPHRAFLRECYQKNLFLASGPKNPWNGGIIIALGNDKAALMEVLKQDPFYEHGIADFEVIEFNPLQYHPTIQPLMTS